MFQTRTRTAYSRHVLRAHLQGFAPLSWVQFQKFTMFSI